MAAKFRVFLDTSALFAGIWSAKGGARMILKLGEAGVIQLVISQQVLEEIENVTRRKAPTSLGALALLLDRSQVEVTTLQGDTNQLQVQLAHPGDAQIFASALASKIEYFVTLDRRHFLKDNRLRGSIPFPMGTPGDYLDWFRSTLHNSPSSR